MKLDSELFDRIRIKPAAERTARRGEARCEAAGCEQPGSYRAPKGRGQEGAYYCFCIEHVREYNRSYNYFSGMSDADISHYIKASTIGHRPTWAMGVNQWARETWAGRTAGGTAGVEDPFDLFEEDGAEPGETRSRPAYEIRALRKGERKALNDLGLDETASPDQIKAQFKTMVKRFHPDLNGGDRRTEDKLREVIQAYNHLKSKGLC